ncbi:Uncharacterised protein [Amycolatopsis camponoti]|uniref:Uncharacterized protein n=1 Tax=Amycolatopsis camponoti TaxID=2606593 RepID=A0A6I8M284_9PSEU|nr:Uncharacterised protein [Amycolatopsis camponoti]
MDNLTQHREGRLTRAAFTASRTKSKRPVDSGRPRSTKW